MTPSKSLGHTKKKFRIPSKIADTAEIQKVKTIIIKQSIKLPEDLQQILKLRDHIAENYP